MKYLKYFETEAEYNAFIQSEDFILPNVSYAVDTDSVFYNIVKTESGDYKVILLEKKDISGLTYNMVDLGLPSGLLWADRNVGASAPEDFGTYFAWGETEGYNVSQSITYCTAEELCVYLQPMIGDEIKLTPDNIDDILSEMEFTNKDVTTQGDAYGVDKCFSWDFSDYFDTTDGGETFNKYTTDKLIVLQPEDDAATVYMGSEYRIPNWSNIKELIDNTTPIFIDLDDNEFSKEEAENEAIAYYNFKGVRLIGSNGNSIFIPATGQCLDSWRCAGFLEGYLTPSNLRAGSNTHTNVIMFNIYGDISISTNQRSSGNIIRGVKKGNYNI